MCQWKDTKFETHLHWYKLKITSFKSMHLLIFSIAIHLLSVIPSICVYNMEINSVTWMQNEITSKKNTQALTITCILKYFSLLQSSRFKQISGLRMYLKIHLFFLACDAPVLLFMESSQHHKLQTCQKLFPVLQSPHAVTRTEDEMKVLYKFCPENSSFILHFHVSAL